MVAVASSFSPGTCDVWWAAPACARPGLLDLLDAEERRRHARFRLQADRDRFLVAHALARLVCAHACGLPPEEVAFTWRCRNCDRPEPHGKPLPDGAARGLEVSWTHSGDRVGVALARGAELGLDVELLRSASDIEALSEHVLGSAERAAFEALPAPERLPAFFTYWTRKEALLKATGHGLAGGLDNVEVSAPGEPAAVLGWRGPGAPAAVWLTDLDAGSGYRAALAALVSGPLEVSVHDGAPLLAA